MSNIEITLPDGSSQPVAAGTRPADIARSISPRLADAAIVAKVNGQLYDLKRPIEQDAPDPAVAAGDHSVVFSHVRALRLVFGATFRLPEAGGWLKPWRSRHAYHARGPTTGAWRMTRGKQVLTTENTEGHGGPRRS